LRHETQPKTKEPITAPARLGGTDRPNLCAGKMQYVAALKDHTKCASTTHGGCVLLKLTVFGKVAPPYPIWSKANSCADSTSPITIFGKAQKSAGAPAKRRQPQL
jgi:hypothetical protein